MSEKLGKRLLALVYEENQIFLHLDSAGVDLLLKELEHIKNELAENDCPHSHLYSSDWGGWELSSSRMMDGESEGEPIHHLKIFGWNEEWAEKHGFDRSIE